MINNEKMKEYLKQVVDLESSIYMQERFQERTKKELKFVAPRHGIILSPHKEKFIEPQKPVRGESMQKQKKESDGCKVIASIFIGLTIFGAVLAWYVYNDYLNNQHIPNYPKFHGFFIVFSVIAAIAALIYFLKWRSYNKAIDDKYRKDLEEYEKSVHIYQEQIKREEERYKADMEIYERREAEEKQRYDNEYAIAESNYKQASQLVVALERPLVEAKSLLEKLYSLGFIFPKYRNLIAMCTIYEYYMTGRVSELEGPNGAYNLYESELRQNLIINKLDTIITQLEQVKENQFILYQEVQKTNKTLNGISQDIKGILDTTMKIENKTELISRATNLTAYYSQITAHNTEAIKYLELINR